MKLTYTVPRDNYIALLADMIRRNDRRPIRILTALLMTVGQMGVVILLCIFKLDAGQRIFFLIWSVLLAALTVLRRCTVRQRAKGTLQRLEYSGQLPKDYWEKHRLKIDDQGLHLQYGDQECACALSAVSRIDRLHDALYIHCGDAVFDIIPQSAFDSAGAMEEFAQKLQELASGSAPLPAGKDVQVPQAQIHWEMDARSFLNAQYLAYRTLYYRYRFLRKATFLRLAVSVFAVVNLVSNHAVSNVVICVLLLILANLENLSMLPPICKKRIDMETGNWKKSAEYGLSMEDGGLRFTSQSEQAFIPFGKINLCEQVGNYAIIAWKNFPAVVMPKETLKDERVAQIFQHVQSLLDARA